MTDNIAGELADLYYDDRINFESKSYRVISHWLTSRYHGELVTDVQIYRIQDEIAEVQDGFYKRTGVFLKIPQLEING